MDEMKLFERVMGKDYHPFPAFQFDGCTPIH